MWWGSQEQGMKTIEGARILVVDDEEGIRKPLKVVLEENGYMVDTAENGRSAISKAKAGYYDLALIDIRLPDMDGVEVLKALGESTPKMVRIIITGYPSLENAIDAVNRGADGYIVKPFTMESLLHTIKEHLHRQKEAKKYSEEKVREYIESRIKEQETKPSRRRARRT
jgi:two-component system phosphate regulon sensor histidine kinase PhoR